MEQAGEEPEAVDMAHSVSTILTPVRIRSRNPHNLGIECDAGIQ